MTQRSYVKRPRAILFAKVVAQLTEMEFDSEISLFILPLLS